MQHDKKKLYICIAKLCGHAFGERSRRESIFLSNAVIAVGNKIF